MAKIKLKKKRSKKRTNITVTDNPRSCDFWNKNKQGLNKAGEVAALFFAARYKNRVWQCGWQRRWPVVTEQSWLWQSREAKKEEDRAAVSGWWQRTRKETGRKKTGAGAPWAWGTRFLQMRHPLFLGLVPTNHSTTLTTLDWGSLGIGTESIKSIDLKVLIELSVAKKILISSHYAPLYERWPKFSKWRLLRNLYTFKTIKSTHG